MSARAVCLGGPWLAARGVAVSGACPNLGDAALGLAEPCPGLACAVDCGLAVDHRRRPRPRINQSTTTIGADDFQPFPITQVYFTSFGAVQCLPLS